MIKKKLNVGVFTHDFYPFLGGQGRHIYSLYVQNQKQRKINMYVFSPALNHLKNHVRIFPETLKNKFKNIGYSIKLHFLIDRLIKNYNLEIAHFHGGPGGLFLFKKISIPTIYTCHHTYWQQYQYVKNQKWKFFLFILEKYGYKFADKIICVSTSTLNVLLTKYNIPKNKLVYIPNGIEFKKKEFKKLQKNKYKELIYVGRLDDRKGIDFLVLTMKKINFKNKNIRLNIIGIGKNKNKLINFSRINNLNIKFHGFLSDPQLEQLYKKINIQIVPSVFEGFGISVLEGMVNQVPIIATNVDGIKDIIKPNYNGILINYGNQNSLASSVLNLLENRQLSNYLVKNAYESLNQYKWSDIYIRTTNIYEQVH